MSLSQFIKINRQINALLSEEYLSGIYQRVTGNKFEVGNDPMEHVYDRITFGVFDKEIGEEEL